MQGWGFVFWVFFFKFFVLFFFLIIYTKSDTGEKKKVEAFIFFYNGLANSDSAWEVIRVSCMGTLLQVEQTIVRHRDL